MTADFDKLEQRIADIKTMSEVRINSALALAYHEAKEEALNLRARLKALSALDDIQEEVSTTRAALLHQVADAARTACANPRRKLTRDYDSADQALDDLGKTLIELDNLKED